VTQQSESSPDLLTWEFREMSLGYQVNHLARLFERALRLRIAGYKVVPGQFPQLLALYDEDGLTQKQLCDQVKVEQPTMANTLNRMERDGLIHRVRDERDGRQARVMLTERAKNLSEPLLACATEVNDQAIRDLSREELEQLLRLIGRLVENLS
jgi:DNA-binding MarR family transcriptional regulator